MPGKNIIFDISDVLVHLSGNTTVTGIQRVSFEVVRRAVSTIGADKARLGYWSHEQRAYMLAETAPLIEHDGFALERFSQTFSTHAHLTATVGPTLKKYRNRPGKYRFYRFLRQVQSGLRNDAYFRKRKSSLAEWRAFAAQKDFPKTEIPLESLNPKPFQEAAAPGSTLVVMGATWGLVGLNAALKRLQTELDLDLHQFVHDLIPIVASEHIAGAFSEEFYDWLEQSLGFYSRYIANSQNTARDLAMFMAEVGQEKPIQVVPLAQGFTQPTERSTAPPDRPLRAHLEQSSGMDRTLLNMTKQPYVLVVGTLETRKNLWRLAQAWQRLTLDRDIEVPKLVFAGQPGWCNDDFDALMQSTGNLGGWVRVIRGPSDAELEFLYDNCLFTAMVSVYEGWGLPVGEGLAFGKTGVVADNSSLPEVGSDLVEYCDAHSIESIYQACRKLIKNPAHRAQLEARIAGTDLRGWDDVAADVLSALDLT